MGVEIEGEVVANQRNLPVDFEEALVAEGVREAQLCQELPRVQSHLETVLPSRRFFPPLHLVFGQLSQTAQFVGRLPPQALQVHQVLPLPAQEAGREVRGGTHELQAQGAEGVEVQQGGGVGLGKQSSGNRLCEF